MILLKLALLLGIQRHAGRIVALRDPAIASRAKKGDLVTSFDHFDLLQIA
jgi:hypothetical protein